MNWLRDLNEFRRQISSKVEFEELAGHRVRKPLKDTADLVKYFDRLCSHYLNSSSEEQAHIREACNSADVQWYVREYLKHISERTRGASAMENLQLGLAGASIIGPTSDPMDFLYDLGYLYRASQQAGIHDPMPVFRQGAKALRDSGADSTAELMSGFYQTAVCRELEAIPSKNLKELIRFGDIAGIKKLIAAGTDLNAPGEEGRTPLMVAASKGDSAIIHLLLSAGAEVNALDDEGASALVYAARSGHRRAVEMILSTDARIDVKPNGLSLLTYLETMGASSLPHISKVLAVLRQRGAS